MAVPKVLVGSVTYEGKDYAWKKFYNNITRLSYPDYDFVIIDNSKTLGYTKELSRRMKGHPNYHVYHVERGENSREAHADSLNKLREVFLAGKYDYLMMIESDLVPPTDIIERLIYQGKDVIGTIYLIGFAGSKDQPPRPCLFEADPRTRGTRNLPPEEGFKYFGSGVVRIHGCGFGSTLFKRWVLEKFKFWYDMNPPIKHSDVLFFKDYHNEGYQAWVDTDIMVPHYNSNWTKVKDI